MRRAHAVALVLVLWGATAPAIGGSGNLEATIIDTYKFKLRLDELTFNAKAPPGSGVKELKHEHVPVTAGGKTVNLWLVQIDTAEFSAKGRGLVEVKAVLQGEKGDEINGVVADATRYFFAGRIVAGSRKGRRVRVPLAEVKSLKIHTKYQGTVGPSKMGRIVPMPAVNQNVLWVSSVPLGAQVFAKPFNCPAARVWQTYIRIGETPLLRELGPGTYAVKVLVPQKLAGELRPSTKLGEDTNPFEHDGWGEIAFRQGENVVASVTYTVVKTEGKASTLISLFQRKGASLAEVVAACPKGHNFNFNDKKLAVDLRYQLVPENDVKLLLEALHRGGKVIWHGPKKSLMVELTPGARGWKIGGALRPKGKWKK